MFYHGIHARRRADGSFAILAAVFSAAQGEVPQSTVEQWQQLTANPRVGEEYSALHRFLDNRIIESFDLPHPDTAAKNHEALVEAEAKRARDERAAEAIMLLARLEELAQQGVTPEEVGLHAAEKALRLALEAEAAAEAEAAKTNSSQAGSGAGDLAHNQTLEGSRPSPATNTPTPDQGAEGSSGAPESSAPAPSPPPLSGKQKPS